MSPLEAALDYARDHQSAHLNDLKQAIAVPSVSTLPEHSGDVARMADLLAEELRRLRMDNVEIIPTAGHPIVYGESLNVPGKPTVLVYGHYDVQPVDPINEWNSGPFDGAIDGDYIIGRGASDMKGQLLAHLKALEAIAAQGDYPVNLKYMLEGEEEVGSPNLEGFIKANKDKLACDFVLNCDAGIHAPDTPAIMYALRGLAYFELNLHGATKDLHSGIYGGSIANPAQVLCELIAGMHDKEGRVTLPGFYDNVRPLEEDERNALAAAPHSDDDWLVTTGAPALSGEEGYTTLERVGARPTLEVNGFLSGFTGQGSKTVLPAHAMAKISMRLVADQDGHAVARQLREYLSINAPDTVTWELKELAHGPGAIMDRNSTYMKAAVGALTRVFGREPFFKREGGSIPVVAHMQQILGVDSVMLGFALPDDGIHGPNERQHIPTYFKGIQSHIHFLHGL